MHVDYIYEQGDRAVNEDAYVLNEQVQLYAALDGATGLDGAPGYIASQALRAVFDQTERDMSLHWRLQEANVNIQEKTACYYGANTEEETFELFSQLSEEKRSSAAMIAVKFNQAQTRLEYVHAGDCMLFLQYDTGAIRRVTQDLVQDLDGMVIEELVKLQQQWPDARLDQLRKKLDPLLQKNRQKANTPGGYSVMDGSQAALEYLDYGCVSLNKVSGLLLVSDGLQLPQSLDVPDSWMPTAELAFCEGIDGLYEEVVRREASDPHCTDYPRLKRADDKTGILMSL